MTDSELAWQARQGLRLSQRAFARLIGAHPSTVAEWESGRGAISSLTRSLLRLVVCDPGLALEALGAPSALGQGERCNCRCDHSGLHPGRALCSPRATGPRGQRLAVAQGTLLTRPHDLPRPVARRPATGSSRPVGREG